MITKLKWLKSFFTRQIVPANGATVGKILYTAKNTTGRRVQYVIDVDNNNMDVTTIDASPASTIASTGAIVVKNDVVGPKNDKNLYILASYTPAIARATTPAAFSQSIANGAAIAAINILTGVNITNYAGITAAATTVTATLTSVAAAGLTLNTGTGEVTLDNNLVAGTYTLSYKIEVKTEPTLFVIGIITVIVAA